MLKKVGNNFCCLIISFLISISIISYRPFSISAEPYIIPPTVDDVTDVVGVLLPMVVSNSNNTSLVKYNPWKSKIKAAINTLITLGVYNLVNVANDLGVTVSSLVGGTVTFTYNSYNFIKDVWKTIKETDGIEDNSSGSVSDGSGSLPDGVLHFTPTYWTNNGFTSQTGGYKIFMLSTDKNIYMTKIGEGGLRVTKNVSGSISDPPLAWRFSVWYPFTFYTGYLESGKTYTFSVSSIDDSDYKTSVRLYERSNGESSSSFLNNKSRLTQTDSVPSSTDNVSNYPTGGTYNHSFTNDTSYSISTGNKDYDFIFVQYVKPYADVSSYFQYSTRDGFTYIYYDDYSGSNTLWDGSSNVSTQLTNVSNIPLQIFLNDFLGKHTMSFNGIDMGVVDYGGYTVGNSEPDVYNNPYYENKINYSDYNGDDFDELKQLIIQSYDNGTDIADYTRQLYDVNTGQLVQLQDINSTNNSILQLLLNGSEYTDGYISNTNDTFNDFNDLTDVYYNLEDGFNDNFNDSLNDLTLSNPMDWGSSFIASSNWVKDQYDRMTVNTQIGKLLSFSLALGFVMLLIGRFMR